MALKTATAQEIESFVKGEIDEGSIAEGLVTLGTAAKLSGKWLRVFDIRYATAGNPTKITRDYVMFPPGSIEVLETGNLSGPAANFEELAHPRLIATQAIIQAEVCEPSKPKK
jgi:hypothetical protein